MEENDNSDIFYQQGIGIGPFQMMNKIGEGRFGEVYIGIHEKAKEKVAIKQIQKSEKVNIKTIYDEINIQKQLFHPYLCKMYCVIENPNYIYIVNEYCGGGELFKLLEERDDPFDEPFACKIFSQILSGLEYLHNNYISHRDIKLENMLLDDFGDAKLTDFGLSKSFKGDIDFKEAAGSPMYAAPEVIRSQPHKGKIADIWSIGICLYVMVCGDFPFKGDELEELVKNIIYSDFEIPDFVSPSFKDLIIKILDKKPKNRLTIEQIKMHPWLHSIDFNFMKSPGIIINEDILPIDHEIIKDMVDNNKKKIRNIISDILTNKHNNNTILYYLKVEIMKKNKGLTISDIRPTSELFIKYINNAKSKLNYYKNNINKCIDELTEEILNEFKMQEKNIRKKIKNSLDIKNDIINNNINNDKINENNNVNNKENINDKDNNIIKDNNKKGHNFINKTKINKKFKKLMSKTYKFDDFKKFIKKEEKTKKEEKKDKFALIKEYIGPLIFINDIIDEIITKVVKLKYKKEIISTFIPVNNSSINVLSNRSTQNIFVPIKTESNIFISNANEANHNHKFSHFAIDIIQEFGFPSTTRNDPEKTFSFGFYKQKNNIKDKNLGSERKLENIKKGKINIGKNLNNSLNNKKDGTKNKNLNDRKYEKKKIITKLHSKNLSNVLNHNFPKIKNEFKNKIDKIGILKKNKNKVKRSLSQKYINKINIGEINANSKDKKRSNSEKKDIKNIKIFQGEKKEKKNDIKHNNNEKGQKIFQAKKIKGKQNISKKIEDNLNINEILSEKKRFKKTINNDDEMNKKINKRNRNYNLSQENLNDKNKLMNSTINYDKKPNLESVNNSAQKERRYTGRKFVIIRSKNTTKDSDKTIKINKNKSNNLNHKAIHSTNFSKIIEKPKKNKDIKTSIFSPKNNQNINSQTGRNQKKSILVEKNNSTNDSSAKKQINSKEKKNIQFKSLKSSSISNNHSIRKKLDIGQKNITKNEIKTKKKEEFIKNIIKDKIGSNNVTISNLANNHTRFGCKIYINKKKLVFTLDLVINEKNINILSGELSDGDTKSYQKIFNEIKEKLE